MVITLVWETAKMFLMFTAGLYALVALILLIYLPFCIADCLRQRRAVGRWASATTSASGSRSTVDPASTLQPIL
jgi:hypothetical protein